MSLLTKAQLQIHFFYFTVILGKKAEKLKRAILIPPVAGDSKA